MFDRKALVSQGSPLLVAYVLGALSTALVLPAFRAKEKVAVPPSAPQQALAARTDPVPPPPEAKTADEEPSAGVKSVKPLVAPGPVAEVTPLPTAPVEPPRVSSDPKPDTKAVRPRPEDVLLSKGLKRFRSVFVLDEEQQIRTRIDELGRLQLAWQTNIQQMLELQQRGRPLVQGWNELQQKLLNQPLQPTVAPTPPIRPENASRKSMNDKKPGETDAEKEKREQMERADEQKAQVDQLERNRQARDAENRNVQEIDRIRTAMTTVESQYYPLLIEYRRLESLSESQVDEFKHRQRAISDSVDALLRKYDELSRNPEVKSALAELNSEGLHLTLGPVENHKQNLARMLKELLEAKGARLDPKGRITSLAAQDIKSGKENTARLAVQLKNMPSPSYGKVRRNRPLIETAPQKLLDLKARLARAGNAAQRKKHQGILKKEQANLAVRTKEQKGCDDYRKVRDVYVHSVEELGDLVDQARKKEAELAENPVKVKGKIVKVRHLAEADLDYVKRAEHTIDTSEVSLEPEKSLLWVEVFVNGQAQPVKMVVDPSVDAVRIPNSLAEKLGLKPGNPRVSVKVTLGAGQVVEGWQAFLQSVRVGSDGFTANDVECLVLDEAFPVLGASFLEQFASQLDVEAGKLVLKKVSALRLDKLSAQR